jgi:hypothetical protein
MFVHCNNARVVTVAEIAAQAKLEQDPARLGDLASHRSPSVRIAVAENRSAPDEAIEGLLKDPNEVVRLSAAGNLADRPRLQKVALNSPDKSVRSILAYTFARRDDRSLPYDVQAALSRDEFSETRQNLAGTTNYIDLFEALLQDADPKVRGICARNPRITRSQMETLVTDPIKRVRANAAALGLQFPDDEQLLRLARDRSADVRWAVLLRADRPREAIEIIAQDADEINRRHAQSALIDVHNIMTELYISQIRQDRERARNVQPFQPAPV